MTDPIFVDELNVKTRLSSSSWSRDDMGAMVPTGRVDGIEVIVPCPKCDIANKVKFPVNEIMVLLQGGQVVGVSPAGPGAWTTTIMCLREECVRDGVRTRIKFRLTRGDILRHADAIQGLQGLQGLGEPMPAPAPPRQPSANPGAAQAVEMARRQTAQSQAQNAALQRQVAYLQQQLKMRGGKR